MSGSQRGIELSYPPKAYEPDARLPVYKPAYPGNGETRRSELDCQAHGTVSGSPVRLCWIAGSRLASGTTFRNRPTLQRLQWYPQVPETGPGFPHNVTVRHPGRPENCRTTQANWPPTPNGCGLPQSMVQRVHPPQSM